ncbi:uncharacterized protein LOC119552166 isoform X2 [Drosophila subpulchrella]|uniref:uncharacterized protein LOC119552166 isoform X2 n=1 Tax=Drosophila subpulchrella TaxID=1486046 RepID=UPI0018A17546|nr:uncharacterized protein LOC119552166 isoform X2 [Drosophila subpulchrella]
MQVERKIIPLISSSFTHAPTIASLVLGIAPIKSARSFAAPENIIKVLQTFRSALTEQATVQRAKKPVSTVMASKGDVSLAQSDATVPTLTPSTPYLGSSESGSNEQDKYISGLPNNRKRLKLSTLELNSSQGNDVDSPIDEADLDQNARISDSKSDDYADMENRLPSNCNSVIEGALSVDSSERKSPEKLVQFDNNCYVPPEQALVTSVELVVPAPQNSSSSIPVRRSEDPKHSALGESSAASSSTIDNKLQYSTAGLYNSSSSTSILANDKIDGCANDSSNLNLRTPTKLAVTTATGDILIDDRRTSLWTPHHDQSGQTQQQSSEPKQEPVNASSELSYQLQHRQSELLLQIEKESSGTGAFSQAIPLSLQHQHNNGTQEQYGQAEATSIMENQMHHSFYTQMMHQQHLHPNQHQQSMHEHSPRHQQHTGYTSYIPHYQNSPMFGTHQNDHIQRQHQQQQPLQHPMECHGHLHQTAPILQQHQHHLQHERQQIHQHQHQPTQQQQPLHESYHDLIMEDFQEEPSTAFKLTLSPSNAKPENQDDGYETSAGDVLTPNSHSSSTHSVTPQHQMQHPNIGLIPQNQKKPDELVLAKNVLTGEAHSDPTACSSNSIQGQVSASQTHLELSGDTRCSSHVSVVNPYSFMGEEMRMHSPAHRHMETVTTETARFASGPAPMSASNGNQECLSGELYQHTHHSTSILEQTDSSQCGLHSKPTPKKRGRKKKLVADSNDITQISTPASQQEMSGGTSVCEDGGVDHLQAMKPKERKKHDRFNGMSEEEVIKRTIPDHLCDNLDIVIVGINPGLFAAYKGHHYAGPGNHFWKCLYLAGLTQEQMSADEDHKLLKHGIGFTNMVARATKGSADLTRKEIKEGSRILLEKLQRFRPKVAVFNGKLIFEVFSGKKEFHFGRQPDRVDGTDTYIWVMPSSSARCAQLPRAADKVPFYAALKKFRDFLNGQIPHIDESECVFTDQRIRQCSEQQQVETSGKMKQTHQTSLGDPQASLAFVGNCSGSSAGAAECGNVAEEADDKMMPRMTANVSSSNNATDRGAFSFTGDDRPMLPQSLPQQPLEKKKRGRPKKIKGQEIIDRSVGGKIAMGGSHMPQHDFNNILNLSVISAGGSIETPKKKRGRPKKLKPAIDNILSVKQLQHGNTNPNTAAGLSVTSMHPLSMEHIAASPQSSHQMPPSLYNTPPPSHLLYNASASPMASPALNCNYNQVHSHGTPPVGQATPVAQGTSPNIDPQNEHLSPQKQSQHGNMEAGLDMRDQPHLGETPPPSSPNMCPAVDFEPPDEHSDSQVGSGEPNKTVELGQQQSQTVEKDQYDSPARDAEANIAHPHEHYQQWVSPHTQQSLQPAQKLTHQHLHHPMQHFQQEQSDNWQRYEEQNSNPYMLITAHHQNLSPRLGNQSHQNTPQPGHIGSDVARKSLCGLESLVDQIPAIREHECSNIPSATAAAAAAAVESRLLGLHQQQQQQHQQQQQQQQQHHLQQQQQQPQHQHQQQQQQQQPQQQHQQPKRCNQENPVQAESCRPRENSNVSNNNFSVSSLAASASTARTDNEALYGNSGETRVNSESSNSNNNNCGNSIEYPIHSPSGYPHHAPHLMGSAIGANINNSEPNPHHLSHPHPPPHSHPHPMYVDQAHHMAHIPSVNVNSMYSASAYGTHPQHNTGEYAATHSHYSLGGTIQSTGPTSTATLHVPSPNYPFGHHPYSHTPPQANYPSYTHPHTHHHSHHSHPSHHLSVFDHLKPSDISGYGGF